MSPAMSWLIFGALIVAAVLVYVWAVGSAWFDDAERELERDRPEVPHLRIVGGIYDHETRGDLE